MGSTLLQLLFALPGIVWFSRILLRRYVAFKAAACRLKACPGEFILWQQPAGPAALATGRVFPPSTWMGSYYAYFDFYRKCGSTCLSSINIWDAVPAFWLSDADAIKTVQTSKSIFTKDTAIYETVGLWGPNLMSTEGSDWKRHRSIASSAFNEGNNALVWREAFLVVHEWFSAIGSATVIPVNLQNTFIQVTLLIISRAAFGQHATWKEDANAEPPLGHTHTFKQALISTRVHFITKFFAPDWMHRLSTLIHIPLVSPHLSETRAAFDSIQKHMLELISLARAWVTSGKSGTADAALLRNLVEANMSQEHEGSRVKHLTDVELLSNTFLFFLAAHDPSTHSLCFAVMLLALYPEVQQKAYEEVCRLWPSGIPPKDTPSSYKESIVHLEYITALFHEALRLYPAGVRLPRRAMADSTLKAHRFHMTPDNKVSQVEEYDVPIRAGDMVIIDVLALHMNPMYWGHDANDFKPERFIDTETYRWPRDAFQAFAGGSRSCIGQRFAITESVCILAMLLRKYEIRVPEELEDKSFAERKQVMFQWIAWLSMTPLCPKAVFRLRA